VHAEGVPGGFSAVYDVLKAMEEAGKVRRGYFVAGLGATQFALPGADDRLRAAREASDEAKVLVLAATDPANPYGAALAWPGDEEGRGKAQRSAGAYVVLRDGAVIGYLGRSEHDLVTFLPGAEPERGHAAEALASALGGIVESGRRKTLLVEKIDGVTAEGAALGRVLVGAGFSATSKGYFKRGVRKEE
jgi:ATP-dependent Lhr-like helicase